MHLIVLSQENIELAELEASSLLELNLFTRNAQFMFANIKNIKKINRLAYTKKVLELLFICNPKDLDNALYQYDFKKIYKNNFCLRIHDNSHKFNESEYAKYIWKSLESSKIEPKVNLENPSTLIEIIILDNKAFVCRQLWNNKEDFESRKAHQKPELHPTAMHPKMARALVNILNKDNIVDPFCGAGGILTEAALMKIKFKAYDIDQVQLNRAKINLKYLKINSRSYKLELKDATNIKNLKNIVTDLPYGKSSKKTDEIIDLYNKFIHNISGRSVIVFPDFVNYKKILKENLNKKLEIKKIISHYVHKSLTRKIVVIDTSKKDINS
ncbi:TPA: methyltransferase [Candidatus Woesearchaeota archaeon]|nr:methyltransferase [Candidatus Woesearchaeota archaeon]HIH31681.1 methyltransferase [Candidatus Woesearchaeota archaeon]HIH54944.1 methyltransferase [Candidatus Woesearchaeota archaeon]HIJ02637.1 methyltransferase [Candidatus Woesearchaeota archaeon]HIJ13625.1 methyltransferase [Candidatus Woesearchaeota archaeon]